MTVIGNNNRIGVNNTTKTSKRNMSKEEVKSSQFDKWQTTSQLNDKIREVFQEEMLVIKDIVKLQEARTEELKEGLRIANDLIKSNKKEFNEVEKAINNTGKKAEKLESD